MYELLFKKTEAAVVLSESNRFYFTGLKTSFGCVLVTENKKVFFTDFRYAVIARQKVKDCDVVITDKRKLYEKVIAELKNLNITSVGYEDAYMTVSGFKDFKKAFKDFSLKGISAELTLIRSIKTVDEISAIKKAQSITEYALSKTLPLLKSGVTEREIKAELTYLFLTNGADGTAFDSIVAFGENSSDCHHTAGDRKLEKNDVVLFDIGASFGGYCSDMTRTFVYGDASSKHSEIYAFVLEAQLRVLKFLKAGMTGKEADSIAREYFCSNGFEKEFGHALGHGVGIDIHEEPCLAAYNDLPLPENAVVTVEPGLYLDTFGVRIEDMVVIKKDGIENLTTFPKSIII